MFEISDVKLKRDQNLILNIPSLCFKRDVINCIIGANGAGKSTLFKVLLGQAIPQQGQVKFDGKSLSSMPLTQLSRKRAYVAQAQRPVFDIDVLDYLLLARHMRSESKQDSMTWLIAIVEQHQLEHLLDRNIQRLSGGEYQRVEFARACIQLIDVTGYKDKILLLDEPASALDIKQTKQLYTQIEAFKEAGGTALIIEHNINYAANFSQQLLVIKSGEIGAYGPTEKIFTTRILNTCFETDGQVIALPSKHQTSDSNSKLNYQYLLNP